MEIESEVEKQIPDCRISQSTNRNDVKNRRSLPSIPALHYTSTPPLHLGANATSGGREATPRNHRTPVRDSADSAESASQSARRVVLNIQFARLLRTVSLIYAVQRNRQAGLFHQRKMDAAPVPLPSGMVAGAN